MIDTTTERPLTDDAARALIRDATDRTLFVDAGAGSGKTRALVHRVRTLVLRDGVAIENIAAVTFTEKAAAELTDRLRATFERSAHDADTSAQERERAEQALDEIDFAAIGTLHSFAQRILSLHPIEAQIPPRLQVLDEVGSTAASEERWAVIQRRLLDDDAIGDILVPALAMGIKLKDLHSLARAFNNDWDLAEDRLDPDAAGADGARRDGVLRRGGHGRRPTARLHEARRRQALPGAAAAGRSGCRASAAPARGRAASAAAADRRAQGIDVRQQEPTGRRGTCSARCGPSSRP